MLKKIIYLIFTIFIGCGSFNCQSTDSDLYRILSRNSTADLEAKAKYYLHDVNKPDSALIYYSVISGRYDQTTSSEEKKKYSAVLNNMGYIYLCYYYDYTHAIECLLKALDNTEDHKTQAFIYLNIGSIYCYYAHYYPSEENFDNAHKNLRNSFYLAQKAKAWNMAIMAFDNLWDFGFDEKNISANAKELKSYKSMPIPADYPMKKYSDYLYQAILQIKRKDYNGAVESFKKQLDVIVIKEFPQSYECQSYWNIIQVATMADNHRLLLKYADILLAKSKEYDMKDFAIQAYHSLAQYYSSIGDSAKATSYRLLYYKERDLMINGHKLCNIRSEVLRHDLKKVNENVELLTQQRRQQNIIILICAVATLSILILLIILYKKNRHLNDSNEMLYNRINEMLSAEEENAKERKKLLGQLSETNKQKEEAEECEVKKKYNNTNLDDEYKATLLQQIKEVFENTDEICSSDFSLDRLAFLVNSKYKYVSQIINEKYDKGFIILLSEYRIKEACRLMNNPELCKNLTIEGISSQVGFKARSSFIAAFKRVTGLTPSEYIRIAKSKNTSL